MVLAQGQSDGLMEENGECGSKPLCSGQLAFDEGSQAFGGDRTVLLASDSDVSHTHVQRKQVGPYLTIG